MKKNVLEVFLSIIDNALITLEMASIKKKLNTLILQQSKEVFSILLLTGVHNIKWLCKLFSKPHITTFHQPPSTRSIDELEFWCLTPFQQYFSYTMATT